MAAGCVRFTSADRARRGSASERGRRTTSRGEQARRGARRCRGAGSAARAPAARRCRRSAPAAAGAGDRRDGARSSSRRRRLAATAALAAGRGRPGRRRRRQLPAASAALRQRPALLDRVDQLGDRHELAQVDPAQQRHFEVIARLRREAQIGFQLRDQIERAQQILARERGGQRAQPRAVAFDREFRIGGAPRIDLQDHQVAHEPRQLAADVLQIVARLDEPRRRGRTRAARLRARPGRARRAADRARPARAPSDTCCASTLALPNAST